MRGTNLITIMITCYDYDEQRVIIVEIENYLLRLEPQISDKYRAQRFTQAF